LPLLFCLFNRGSFPGPSVHLGVLCSPPFPRQLGFPRPPPLLLCGKFCSPLSLGFVDCSTLSPQTRHSYPLCLPSAALALLPCPAFVNTYPLSFYLSLAAHLGSSLKAFPLPLSFSLQFSHIFWLWFFSTVVLLFFFFCAIGRRTLLYKSPKLISSRNPHLV